MKNTLFQFSDDSRALTANAQKMESTLDILVSAIVGRLVAERLIDYAGQPGQTIEYLSLAVADTIVASMDTIDTVELNRFLNRKDGE